MVRVYTGHGTCSGVLVSRSVVLTARHCVSKAVTTTVSCNQEGNSANGDHVGADLDPSGIQIYAGTSPNFAGSPTALVKKSLHPAGGVLCNADIAVLVLDRDIPGAQTIPVRLQGGLRKGEAIRSVGYGQNDAKVPVGTRLRKLGETITETLERHGVAVERVCESAGKRSVEEVLANRIAATGADLLVIGAYSHSWLREFLFGGVTQRVLQSCPAATFLSR